MRREIGNFHREDFLQDGFSLEKYTKLDDLVRHFKLSSHDMGLIPKDEQDGYIWDPTRPDYDQQPLRCKIPGCKNFPMWKCDSEQNFLRNISYDKVWQGCNGLVCEAHVVKYFDKTEENVMNTFWDQKEYFYDYERWKLQPMREAVEIPKIDCCSCCKFCCKCVCAPCIWCCCTKKELPPATEDPVELMRPIQKLVYTR